MIILLGLGLLSTILLAFGGAMVLLATIIGLVWGGAKGYKDYKKGVKNAKSH